MKKYNKILVLFAICTLQNINAQENPPISGNYAPCTCVWSQNYMPAAMLQGRAWMHNDILGENYKYLRCSCPGQRLTTAFPNSFINNGVTLTYEANTNKLKMTTPKEIDICGTIGGCGGYCNIDAQGNPSCVWGSRAPSSWFNQ